MVRHSKIALAFPCGSKNRDSTFALVGAPNGPIRNNLPLLQTIAYLEERGSTIQVSFRIPLTERPKRAHVNARMGRRCTVTATAADD